MGEQRSGFDPYHQWLGIPKAEQPPHLYRLLGVTVFESDAQVIANAADQRMALLKGFATGRFGEHSQRLLNQVARARVILLDEQRRREYDERLRQRLRVQQAATAIRPARPTEPVGLDRPRQGAAIASDATTVPAVNVRAGTAVWSRYRRRRRGTNAAWLWGLAAVMSGLALMVLIFAMQLPRPSTEVASTDQDTAVDPTEAEDEPATEVDTGDQPISSKNPAEAVSERAAGDATRTDESDDRSAGAVMPEEEPVSIVDLITEGVDVPDELPSIDEFVPPQAKSERAAVPDRAVGDRLEGGRRCGGHHVRQAERAPLVDQLDARL